MHRILSSSGDNCARTWRIALYSPGMVGLGHMRRNLLIGQALARPPAEAAVLMIAEARQATAFAMPPGMDCLALPALRKEPDGNCYPRYLDLPLDRLIAMRAQVIRAALEAFAPDVLIVDHLPRGALGELEPSLEHLRLHERTRCVLGLRDILEDPGTVRHEWGRVANEDAIRDYYDAVWVYGDPAVFDLVREYRLRDDVAERVRYTGYLDQSGRSDRTAPDGADPLEPLALPNGQLAVCLVGGGQDGARLAEAFAEADFPPDMCGVILTGPFMSATALDGLRRRAALNPCLRVLEFLDEPTHLVSRADRVVAMGGYNTISEVLSFEKHALIVPRPAPRPEQSIRAERLRDLGLVHVLGADSVSPRALGDWLARDLGSPPRARERLDLNGLARLPALLDEALTISIRRAPPWPDALPDPLEVQGLGR
jgi:predicted glycosyltransferase